MGEGARGVEIIAIVSHTDMEISYTIAGTIGREEEGRGGGGNHVKVNECKLFCRKRLRGFFSLSPTLPLTLSEQRGRG